MLVKFLKSKDKDKSENFEMQRTGYLQQKKNQLASDFLSVTVEVKTLRILWENTEA